jgi:hypothetical protein
MTSRPTGSRSARRDQRGMALSVARGVLVTLGELGRMVWSRRMWWAIPSLLTLLLVGVLLLLSASPVAPLFYPLF